MNYTIRAASQFDEPFINEMLFEALYLPSDQEPFPRSILSQPDIAHYAAGFGTRRGDVGFIAEAGDKTIAAAWVRLFNNDDRGYGYVDDDTPELSVAVTPQWRGQGVGTALITTLIQSSPRVSLSTDSRNPASRLYERLGFEIVSTEQNSMVMLRSLTEDLDS